MKINNDIIESFLNCKYKSFLKNRKETGHSRDYEILMKNHVVKYRQKFLSKTSDQGSIILWSDLQSTNLKDITYCIRPLFKSYDYEIRFDFAEIRKISSRKWTLIPICIIANEKIGKKEKLAECIKVLIIRSMSKFDIQSYKIIYGEELKVTTVKLNTYLREGNRLILDIHKYLTQTTEPKLFKNYHCKICEFEQECREKLIQRNDLSLLGGMNEKQIIKINDKGLFSIHQLSYTFRPRKYRSLKNIRERYYPELKALAIRENKVYIWQVRELPNVKTEIFFDIEGLTDENFYYLIGVLVRSKDKITKYSFWADSKENEMEIFNSFFALMTKYRDSVIYHYGNYELKALRKINKRFDNVFENKLKSVEKKMINLLLHFSINVYLPTYTNGLKDVGFYLGFKWSEKNASGIQSIVWRKKWEQTLDYKFKQILVQYNLEDCSALAVARDWLDSVNSNISNTHNHVEDINVPKSVFNWRNPDEYMKDTFKEINRYSYFDYQQNKVYIRTNYNSKKSKNRRQPQSKKSTKEKVNQVVEIFPKRCPICKTRAKKNFTLIKESVKRVIDIKFMRVGGVKKWVKLLKGGTFHCKKCSKNFSPHNMKHQIGFGKTLVKWCVSIHIDHYIGFSSISRILTDLNISNNKSQIFRFKEIVSSEYSQTYKKLLTNLIKGPLIQADETTVRIKCQPKGYVWIFASMDSVFYFFKPTREADFLKNMLIGFKGVLVSDFYSGYDSLPCRKQKCLVHLIRDLNADLYKNQLDSEFKDMVNNFGVMLRKIVYTIDRYGLKKRHLNKYNKDVDKYYNNFVEKDYDSDLSKKYQKRFKKHWDNMFTFLRYDNVPWNNNNAEYAIKSFAKHREQGNSTFTEKSISEYMILLSIQQTLKYRGISLHEFLKSGEKNIEVYCDNL